MAFDSIHLVGPEIGGLPREEGFWKHPGVSASKLR